MKTFSLLIPVCISLLLMDFSGNYFYKKNPRKNFTPLPPYARKEKLMHPVLFAENTISTTDDEFGGTFTPDGKTCYFSKSVLRFYIDVICVSEFKNGQWQMPEVAPFSGVYRDFDPVITADGNTMLFTSDRPVHGEQKTDYDIWMLKKTAHGWSDPVHLDSAINSPYNEHFASMAANGTIYFSSDRPGAIGGRGDADIYRSPLENGKYLKAEHLADSVSSPAYELDCVVSPDERFLLIGVYGRSDGYGNYDIFCSKNVNGKFGKSKNLGPLVNSKFRDYSPRISPDGNYLFFTSERDFSVQDSVLCDYQVLNDHLHGILNGSGNIYQLSLEAIGLK
jgi:Tol biopolymer transport system component